MIESIPETIAILLIVGGATGYLLLALKRWGKGETKCGRCCCARDIPFLEDDGPNAQRTDASSNAASDRSTVSHREVADADISSSETERA